MVDNRRHDIGRPRKFENKALAKALNLRHVLRAQGQDMPEYPFVTEQDRDFVYRLAQADAFAAVVKVSDTTAKIV